MYIFALDALKNGVFLVNGYSKSLALIFDSLQSFLTPAVHCGWNLGFLIPHGYVNVMLPASTSMSTVNVETPFGIKGDLYRRVSFKF